MKWRVNENKIALATHHIASWQFWRRTVVGFFSLIIVILFLIQEKVNEVKLLAKMAYQTGCSLNKKIEWDETMVSNLLVSLCLQIDITGVRLIGGADTVIACTRVI